MEGFLDFFFFSLWVLAQKCVGKKGKQRAPYPKQSLLLDTCLNLPSKIAPIIQTRCKEREGEQVSTPGSVSYFVLGQDMERDSNKPLKQCLRKSLACSEPESFQLQLHLCPLHLQPSSQVLRLCLISDPSRSRRVLILSL